MMNILKKFTENNIPVSWETILVGRKLGILDNALIEEYATNILINKPDIKNPYIVELASGISNNFEIDHLLSLLSRTLNEDSTEYAKEVKKWRYILLKNLLNEDLNKEELLQKIEEVYADFDYPEDMSNIIYYNSSGTFDPTKFSKEECLQRLVNIFYEFLIKEQQEISNDLLQ